MNLHEIHGCEESEFAKQVSDAILRLLSGARADLKIRLSRSSS